MAAALEKAAWMDMVANQEKMGKEIGDYLDKLITKIG